MLYSLTRSHTSLYSSSRFQTMLFIPCTVSDKGSSVSDKGSSVSDKGSSVSDKGSIVSDKGSSVSDKGSSPHCNRGCLWIHGCLCTSFDHQL